MPKKTTRSGAQRNRPKVQKNVSLVRPNAGVATEETETQGEQGEIEETQLEGENGVVESSGRVSTATATATTTTTTTTTPASATTTTRSRSRTGRASGTTATAPSEPSPEVKESEATVEEPAPKGSASARLAARRQNQKSQQRVAPTLITAEHYSYVRKDLIYIAVLAVLMFATIIILHLIPGIGF